MAVYRTVFINFWQDSFVEDLTPEERYFYLYLITNTKTTMCGIYKLSLKIAAVETGYNQETVEKLIKRFEEYGKIIYCKENKEIIILNWLKYNPISSPNSKKCIDKELALIKTKEFILKFNEKLVENGYFLEPQEVRSPSETVSEPLRSPSETVSEPLRSPSETVSEPLRSPFETVSNPRTITRAITITTTKTKTPTKEDRDRGGVLGVKKIEPPSQISCTKIINLFNSICTSLPKAEKLTKTREKKIKLRCQELITLEKFEELFRKVQASKFLTGSNDRGWKADFTWLMKNDENYVKVLEGNYDKCSSSATNAKVPQLVNFDQRPYEDADFEVFYKNT